MFDEYVDGGISLYDFIKFLSDNYYVDMFDDGMEFLPFNNMQLVDICSDGKFRFDEK